MKTHNKFTIRYLMCLLLVSSVVFSVVPGRFVSASDYGVNQGYFYNRADGGNFSVLDAGIPSTTNKAEFINYIKNLWSTSAVGSAEYIATSYIIQTMRGPINGGAYDHGFVDAADILDWENKVNNPLVEIILDLYSREINTHRTWGYEQRDVSKFNDSGSFPSMIFRNKDDTNQIYYAIKLDCGNSVGNLPGITATNQWSVSATSKADRTTAKTGDTIHWTHNLINNGPGYTNISVHSNLNITGISDWSNPGIEYGVGDSPSGASTGLIRTISEYSSYTVKDTDAIGSWLCENVRFSPTNGTDGLQGSSAPACVVVRGSPPAAQPALPGACSNSVGCITDESYL